MVLRIIRCDADKKPLSAAMINPRLFIFSRAFLRLLFRGDNVSYPDYSWQRATDFSLRASAL